MKKIFSLAFILIVIASSNLSYAEKIEVFKPIKGQGTIDEQLNNLIRSTNADIIQIPEGVYFIKGPIVIQDRNIKLQGVGDKKEILFYVDRDAKYGFFSMFIIDLLGPSSNKVFIENLSIAGNAGHEWSSEIHTRGILAIGIDDSIIIRNNRILLHDVGTKRNGGGIIAQSSFLNLPLNIKITDNIIMNNSASKGGGIAVIGKVIAVISNNVIYRNEAIFSGGGIYSDILYGANLITNNTIHLNSAHARVAIMEMGGGGIFDDSYQSEILVKYNIISGSLNGSGMVAFTLYEPGRERNCEVSHNGFFKNYNGQEIYDHYWFVDKEFEDTHYYDNYLGGIHMSIADFGWSPYYYHNIDCNPFYDELSKEQYRVNENSDCYIEEQGAKKILGAR